jgi:hypothetical protein
MRSLYTAALAILAAFFPLAAARAQDAANEVGTDIGTLYQDETAPLYKTPGYSPYAEFPSIAWLCIFCDIGTRCMLKRRSHEQHSGFGSAKNLPHDEAA